MAMHLVDYCSIMLGDTILDDRSYLSFPVDTVDVSKFNVDFSKSFILTPNWTASNRKLDVNIFNDIIDHLIGLKIVPVILGKNYTICREKRRGTIYSTTDVGINFEKCANLLNKSTLLETIKIISLSKGIVGLDNGLLHIAGLTNVPIVAAYSNVRPKFRLPIRENIVGKNCYVVYPPDGICRFCQFRFLNGLGVDFSKCDYDHNNCLKSFTSDMFIKQIDRALNCDSDDSKILCSII